MAIGRASQVALVLLTATVMVLAGVLVWTYSSKSVVESDLREETQRASMLAALVNITSELQWEMSLIEKATSNATAELFGRSLNDSHAYEVLNELVSSSPYLINAVTVDRNGTIRAAYPDAYTALEGMMLNDDDPVRTALEQGRPVMSSQFMTLQGYEAVAIGHPIFDAQGTISGAISSLLRPDQLMENLTASMEEGINAMVMQADGLVHYDPDTSQVGRNTFTDPIYQDFPQILAVAHRMVNESSGNDRYSFQQNGEMVEKKVAWTIVSILGERWTVAANTLA